MKHRSEVLGEIQRGVEGKTDERKCGRMNLSKDERRTLPISSHESFRPSNSRPDRRHLDKYFLSSVVVL